jgi:predicted DNA binding protein
VEILADDQKLGPIANEMKEEAVDSEVVRVKKGKAFGLVACPICPAAAAMEDLRCAITSQRVDKDGSVELTILASGEGAFKQLVSRLRNMGMEVEMLRLTSRLDNVEEETITTRQKQVMRKAFELGYYDYPRKIRQKKLANVCGVSSSTLSELLRRAEHNIVDSRIRGP